MDVTRYVMTLLSLMSAVVTLDTLSIQMGELAMVYFAHILSCDTSLFFSMIII